MQGSFGIKSKKDTISIKQNGQLGIIIAELNEIMSVYSHLRRTFTVALFLFCNVSLCNAFSVLTHEAIIDANWENVLVPLLKQRYPGSSGEALKEAHAYAYGGAIAPDMGYYPLGSKLFTNLIHYARSGDFIDALFNDAQNINEYAFAAGVLSHYYADRYGHELGINLCVPVIYQQMKRKFGDTVTYAQNHISHIRTEFSFDVLQTARGNYASEAYHDFIGFKIAQSLLEKAFRETYGLEVDELFGNFPRAVARFRWTVISLFPSITKAAWVNKKDAIKQVQPGARGRDFIYRMHGKNFHHQFEKNDKPRFLVRVSAILIQILPKVGPLRALNFKIPPPYAEKFFIASFDTASAHYRNQLQKKIPDPANIDFDTGFKTKEGEYPLADQTYGKLLMHLKDKRFETVTLPLKQNILSFYADRRISQRRTNEQQKEMNALAELETVQPMKKN